MLKWKRKKGSHVWETVLWATCSLVSHLLELSLHAFLGEDNSSGRQRPTGWIPLSAGFQHRPSAWCSHLLPGQLDPFSLTGSQCCALFTLMVGSIYDCIRLQLLFWAQKEKVSPTTSQTLKSQCLREAGWTCLCWPHTFPSESSRASGCGMTTREHTLHGARTMVFCGDVQTIP